MPERPFRPVERPDLGDSADTLPGMRRRTPDRPGDPRPKLTLIDGGLTEADVERLEARRHHPAGTGLEPDGPEAV